MEKLKETAAAEPRAADDSLQADDTEEPPPVVTSVSVGVGTTPRPLPVRLDAQSTTQAPMSPLEAVRPQLEELHRQAAALYSNHCLDDPKFAAGVISSLQPV
ncbi:unnamed protein product, partial [Polarella glacialis]